nr:hypothetical protein [Tardiphaga sp. vice154]
MKFDIPGFRSLEPLWPVIAKDLRRGAYDRKGLRIAGLGQYGAEGQQSWTADRKAFLKSRTVRRSAAPVSGTVPYSDILIMPVQTIERGDGADSQRDLRKAALTVGQQRNQIVEAKMNVRCDHQ